MRHESLGRVAARLRDPRVLFAIVGLALVLSAQSFVKWDAAQPGNSMMDLRAFWCGGRTVAAHANPYLTEPLRSCEHQIPESLLRRWADAVIPFVHPGYDAAAFEALALLPFRTAAALYIMLAVASLAAAIALLARTLRLRWPLVAGSLALSVGLSTLLYGQLAAFELFLIAASAAALAAGRDRLAGIVGAFTMLEPHVGVFVVVAIVAAVRGARLTLAAGTAGLAVLAVATTGLAAQVMWLARLGAQAAAEARYEGQYSLTYVLTAFGVATPAALAVGALSTVVSLTAAAIVARSLAERGSRAAVVFVPVAFAVAGGTFIHLTQIALAIPAALLLYRIASTPARRALAGAGVVLLSVPWPYPAFAKQILGFSLISLAVVAWHVSERSMRTTLATIVACWLIFATIENHPAGAETAPVVHRAPASAPATTSWAELVAGFHGYDVERIAVKIPTWLGLVAVVLSAALAATKSLRSTR